MAKKAGNGLDIGTIVEDVHSKGVGHGDGSDDPFFALLIVP